MPSSYDKPHLTFQQQIDHLRGKGMIISDEPSALRQLAKIGYYRLSAYWHPFKNRSGVAGRKSSEQFRDGTRFEHAIMLYEYDSNLRRLVLEGVEIVEISLRVWIAYLLGAKDRFAYMNSEMLHANFLKQNSEGESQYDVWLKGYTQKMHRAKEEFTKHFIEKYGQPLPIWASVELWELNQLCHFLSGLKHPDKCAVAQQFGVEDAEIFQSWMKSIKGIRNHAAHHGRIWNRNMAAQPILPKAGSIPELDFIINDTKRISQARACCPLLLMSHLISKVDPTNEWPSKLEGLLKEFPIQTGQSIKQMGFPLDWVVTRKKVNTR